MYILSQPKILSHPKPVDGAAAVPARPRPGWALAARAAACWLPPTSWTTDALGALRSAAAERWRSALSVAHELPEQSRGAQLKQFGLRFWKRYALWQGTGVWARACAPNPKPPQPGVHILPVRHPPTQRSGLKTPGVQAGGKDGKAPGVQARGKDKIKDPRGASRGQMRCTCSVLMMMCEPVARGHGSSHGPRTPICDVVCGM